MVMFKAAAERAYARFRAGDQFVASGYVHEYEFDRDGETVQSEEFVARRIGHDTARTRYILARPAVEREARTDHCRTLRARSGPTRPVSGTDSVLSRTRNVLPESEIRTGSWGAQAWGRGVHARGRGRLKK